MNFSVFFVWFVLVIHCFTRSTHDFVAPNSHIPHLGTKLRDKGLVARGAHLLLMPLDEFMIRNIRLGLGEAVSRDSEWEGEREKVANFNGRDGVSWCTRRTSTIGRAVHTENARQKRKNVQTDDESGWLEAGTIDGRELSRAVHVVASLLLPLHVDFCIFQEHRNSNESCFWVTRLSNEAIPVLRLAKESVAGIGIPGPEAALGGVLAVAEMIQDMQSNKEALAKLKPHLEELIKVDLSAGCNGELEKA
ncbi:hypothetical protein B0H13DRAFT_2279165 [Mycena leptocephala]|nr:hypothetical protein B0H13DRAFT_2279165 [Mycena leptocephala]